MTDRLYLPISEETLESLLDNELTENETFNALSIPEVSALVVLSQLASIKKSDDHLANIERILAGVIEAGVELKLEAKLTLQEAVKKKLNRSSVQSGLSLAASLDLSFLSQDEVRAREYLDTEGRWDSRFTKEKNTPEHNKHYEFYSERGEPVSLIGSQLRLYNEFKTDIEDNLHVEGYAGTGKTHLLAALVELLLNSGIKERQILAIAYRNEQRKVLESRLPAGVVSLTFGNLASDIVPELLEHPEFRRLKVTHRHRSAFSAKRYAQVMSLPPVGKYQPASVANALYQTVTNYCVSDSDDIDESHIPAWLHLPVAEDRTFIVNQAVGLWMLVINPPKSTPMQLPLHDYHIIKQVALQGWSIPKTYTHVILDESHDISPAFAQILNNSPQAVLSLGDKFQRVRGRQGVRNTQVRQRNITRSHRVPQSLGRVVNAILDIHPLTASDEFKGNDTRETEIIYYEAAKVPDEPVAIWVHDEWELFEWVQRIAAHEKPREYRLIGSLQGLSRFVSDSLSLYRSNTPSRHFTLLNYKSWSDAWFQLGKNRAFRQVSRVFESGYSEADWKTTEALYSTQARYVVGMYEDSRNQEFNAVMLAPSIVEHLREVSSSQKERSRKTIVSELASKLYLGTTRTKQKLYAPIELREFIEELNLV